MASIVSLLVGPHLQDNQPLRLRDNSFGTGTFDAVSSLLSSAFAGTASDLNLPEDGHAV